MSTVIEQLQVRIRDRSPTAEIVLDPPKNPAASWWLDVRAGDLAVTVEWRPARGVGVSARPDAVFGERSDEMYDCPDQAFARVDQLLREGGRTAPSP